MDQGSVYKLTIVWNQLCSYKQIAPYFRWHSAAEDVLGRSIAHHELALNREELKKEFKTKYPGW